MAHGYYYSMIISDGIFVLIFNLLRIYIWFQ